MTSLSFILLVVALAWAVIGAFRKAKVSMFVLAGLAIVDLILPGVLAQAGALNRYNPLPAPALILVAAVSIVTAAIALGPLGSKLTRSVPLGVLVVAQVFRIPVELILHRLYLEGTIPVQMTYAGRNFDLVTGISGLALGLWLVSGRGVSRWVVLLWNVLGLSLLVNIVVVAILSTPVPFRLFTNEPPNLLPSTFPYIWLPTFLVQVAWGSHLLIFRSLLSKSATEKSG